MMIDLILFILLLASCGNLVPRAVELEKTYKYEKKSTNPNIFALYIGVGFGFLSSLFFVVDMVLSYKSYQTQRAQETSPDQRPSRRQAGDVNKNYLKSPVFYAKLVEIALLFAAWVSILMHSYIPGTDQLQYRHYTEFILFEMRGSKPLLFRGITIFCWATVICLALTSVFSFDKLFKRSSRWTQMTLIIYFILFILLSASWGNLTSRAVLWGAPIKGGLWSYTYEIKKPSRLDLVLGLAFGFLSCVVFVVDMVLSYKLYKTQLAQETSPDQGYPQRQAGDVNTKFLRSSAFCVRLAEFVFLFAAWVCIVNYIDFILFDLAWGSYQFYVKWPGNWDLKADFFHGVTVACWVMVSILVLTSVLSLDKLCRNRSSRWTLTTMIIYFILSILLIASCGYLTPRAFDLKSDLSQKNFKSWPAIALLAGLVCGYISWLIFMLDICLLCILYRKQRAEEVRHPQQARHQQHTDQPLLTQQPAEVVDSAKLHSVSYV